MQLNAKQVEVGVRLVSALDDLARVCMLGRWSWAGGSGAYMVRCTVKCDAFQVVRRISAIEIGNDGDG